MRMIYVKHCGGDRPYIHPNQLEALHQEVRRQSIEKFRCARKMGGEEMSQNYQQELEIEILEFYGKKILFFLKFSKKKNFCFQKIIKNIMIRRMFLHSVEHQQHS